MQKQAQSQSETSEALSKPGPVFTNAPGGERMTRADFMSKLEAQPETDADRSGDESRSAEQTFADALNSQSETTEASDDASARETASKPKTLKELAERLELEVADLYGIEFNVDLEGKGAETRTIGELKDLLSKTSAFETEQSEFAESRARAENELLRAKQDLQTIMQALPKGSINKEILERARRERETYVEQEEQRLLEAVSEWKDEKRRADDRAAMASHLSEYGFTATQLDGIIDHRMIKYIRDNMLRKQRVDAAMKQVKERKVSSTQTGARQQRQTGRKVAIPDAPAHSSTELRGRFQQLG